MIRQTGDTAHGDFHSNDPVPLRLAKSSVFVIAVSSAIGFSMASLYVKGTLSHARRHLRLEERLLLMQEHLSLTEAAGSPGVSELRAQQDRLQTAIEVTLQLALDSGTSVPGTPA
ncbi:hypothetical protein [Paraburkholderia caledonica]|uniref:hypothetical protein n=1 Tax=Paraburkholderia caledonica TaxID=134536 RepID=UPI0038B809FE